MKRSDARKEVMFLCFEYAFKGYADAEGIYALANETREFGDDAYIKDTFFGIVSELDFIDSKIKAFSNGWNLSRISPVTLAVMRTAVYEMYRREDVPDTAAIDEALNLVNEFDDPKLKAFANGILNAVMKDKNATSDSN